MSKLSRMVSFELFKAFKYKTIFFTLGTSLLMGLAIYSSSKEEALMMYSTLMFTDIVIMGMFFMVSSLFYERQEGTLKSVIVSPISVTHIILSKTIVNIVYGLLSFTILTATLFANLGIDFSIVNFYIVLPAIIVTVFFHSMLGFLLGFISKDFNSTLVNYFYISLPLMFIPLIVAFSPDSPELVKYLVMISPSEASNYLFGASLGSYELWRLIFSYSYLTIMGLIFYTFIVRPKFKNFAMKGE